MILQIKKYPDPILRKKCQEVSEITDKVRKLIDDMIETMYRHQGVGLAAPQVGVEKRIIVVDVGKGLKILINPKIIHSSGKSIGKEGCLSLPGLYLKIKRAKEIVVEGLDKNGQTIKLKVRGFLARAIQHEIDHLNGILIINRLPWWQRIWISFRTF